MVVPSILFLEVLTEIKGGQRMLLDLMPAFSGWERHVVVPGLGPLSGEVERAGGLVHVMPMAQYGLLTKGALDVLAFARELGSLSRRVAKLSRQLGADVLFANSSRAFAWGTLAAQQARLPMIWQAHNLLVDAKTLHLTRTLARLPAVQRIIGYSPSATRQFHTGKGATVPLAVDLTTYRPSETNRSQLRAAMGISPETFVVAHVGDLIPLKGQTLLVEAAGQLPQVRFLVLGAPRQDQPSSVGYANDLYAGASSNVGFLGERHDVPEILAAVDALVITSTQETGPRVLAEAMATALPVISTKVGMAPDLLRPGETGYLIEQNDAAGLIACLQALAADRASAKMMGLNARRLAEDELSIERYRIRVRSLVEEALAIASER